MQTERKTKKNKKKKRGLKKVENRCFRTRSLEAFDTDNWSEHTKWILSIFLQSKYKLFRWGIKRMAFELNKEIPDENKHDLCVDTMVRYFKAYHYFQPCSLNKKLLFEFCYTEVMNFNRKKKRRQFKAQTIKGNPCSTPRGLSPEQSYIQIEFKDEILSRLQSNKCFVLKQKYIYNKTYQEISKALNLTVNQVRYTVKKEKVELIRLIERHYSKEMIEDILDGMIPASPVCNQYDENFDAMQFSDGFPVIP